MKETIVYEEQYREELREYYDSLLKGRLLSLDLKKVSDDELNRAISVFCIGEKVINNNFCSWVTIGETKSSEYNGRPYKFVNFLSEGKEAFQINFSQFRYPMSPRTRDSIFPSFDAEKANYVCSVDGQSIAPESFFPNHKGEKLLLLYCFPAVTSFGQSKLCYFFAHEDTSPLDIRKYFKTAQYLTLKDVLDDPTVDAPGTTIKFDSENDPNCRPCITHSCKTVTTNQFATKLFDKEFRIGFEKLYYEVIDDL